MVTSQGASEPGKTGVLRRLLDLNFGYHWDGYFVLLLVSIALRVVWLDVPNGYGTGGTLIFDEYLGCFDQRHSI